MIDSTILRTATIYLFPVLVLFSVVLLLRGHNEPGGGFIGGLLAATAFALYALAYDVRSSRRLLRIGEQRLLGVGLLCAAASGLPALFAREPYLTGRWGGVRLPLLGEVKLGTPLLFDVGVYLVVIAVTLMIVFALAEEEEEESP